MSIEALLDEIRAIPIADRRLLIGLIEETLTDESPTMPTRKRSILELAGLGAELWQGVDAQAYVRQLRDEWDDLP